MNKKKRSLMAWFAVLLLILILPFNIIGITTAFISYSNSIKNTETVISYTLDSYASLLKNKISNTESALYELANNDTTLLSMSSSRNESQYLILRSRLFVSMNSQVRTSNIAETVFVYMVKQDDYIQFPGFTGFTAGTRPHFQYIENPAYSITGWFLSEDHSQLIRVLYDNRMDMYYGAAVDLTAFLAQLEGITNFPSLTFSFGEAMLPTSASRLCFNDQVAKGIYLSAELPTKDLNASISFLQYAQILFFIIYLALIPTLFFILKRYVGIPLDKLNFAHTQLKMGNEDYRIAELGNSSEFNDAYESFNLMAASMKQLHKEVIDKELSNKQLQIDYLQLQIRPHFLLNSFNVLFTLIQRGQREHAQEMVLFLSDYFRYLFRSGNELQLFSKERKLIEDYMNISKISYPVSFEVSYQIDPILNLMRVPPLLLHSFMENIIAHALLPDRQVHIVFSGEYDDGIITFYISDDGKGMDSDTLDSINRVAERPMEDGRNVGVKNSILRLKYHYGDAATVECSSEPDIGTTFIITIPYNLEEEQDEPIDCQ